MTGEQPYIKEEEFLEEADPGQDEVMGVLAATFPWVVSLLMHVALFLILLFVMFIIQRVEIEDEPYIPSSSVARVTTPFARPRSRARTRNKTFSRTHTVNPSNQPINPTTGRTNKLIDITSVGGASTPSGGLPLTSGDITGIPSIFPGPGTAYNVVYVIDRSGSMIDTFDLLRREMIRSIYGLKDSIYFHTIFFASNEPVENPPGRLVPASRIHKKAASRFIAKEIIPSGQTDPVPALRRAFEVLKHSPKKGWVIHFLTDGAFQDNEAVLKTIEKYNPDGRISINTFLYGNRPPEAVEVMKAIASRNGGQYVFIEYR